MNELVKRDIDSFIDKVEELEDNINFRSIEVVAEAPQDEYVNVMNRFNEFLPRISMNSDCFTTVSLIPPKGVKKIIAWEDGVYKPTRMWVKVTFNPRNLIGLAYLCILQTLLHNQDQLPRPADFEGEFAKYVKRDR